ncbi:glycosyltransferase [Photobacterium leiognathi]|uniref:glycosyltransferase n=1 Tax=Photobacterium leiognathi TaxID=553611 RepID=UPI002980DF9B|nr:glycosyltransferase [Photobacterium leiognathi]
MKKILLLSNLFPSKKDPSFGTFVYTNYEQLKSFDYNVDLCVISKKNKGIISKLCIYISFFSKCFFYLTFRRYKFDFVYIHYLTISTIPLFLIMKLLRIKPKYAINIHGDDLVGKGYSHRILSFTSGFILKNASCVIVPSDYFRKELFIRYPESIKNTPVLVNYSGGVNTDLFNTKKALSSRKLIYGYLGRIEEGKGWDDLLNAINLLQIDNDVEFHFYGKGKQKDKLLEAIESNINKINIKYFGEVPHHLVPNVMKTFTYFVFPTYRESLGLVALESMSCGVPVIRSNIEPLNDIFCGLSPELTFTPGDIDEICKAINYSMLTKNDNYHYLRKKSVGLAELYSSVNSKRKLDSFLHEVFYAEES